MLELGLRPMWAAIISLTPGSPGSDLNPMNRTYCMCSVKCAEPREITSQGGIVPYKSPAFIIIYFGEAEV